MDLRGCGIPAIEKTEEIEDRHDRYDAQVHLPKDLCFVDTGDVDGMIGWRRRVVLEHFLEVSILDVLGILLCHVCHFSSVKEKEKEEQEAHVEGIHGRADGDDASFKKPRGTCISAS